MESRPYLVRWLPEGEKYLLIYSDGDVIPVKTEDFNRAFGSMVNNTKELNIRDFAIKG